MIYSTTNLNEYTYNLTEQYFMNSPNISVGEFF